MGNTEIRLIIFFATKDGKTLYSQQKQDLELTMAQIMSSLLQNSGLNWIKQGKPLRLQVCYAMLNHFSRVRFCAPLSLGFSRQEHWSGLPFPSPMHEGEKWKWSRSIVSDPQRPHGLQPTRVLCPWDFPGKSTGVGCHCLLHLQVWPKSNLLWFFSGSDE